MSCTLLETALCPFRLFVIVFIIDVIYPSVCTFVLPRLVCDIDHRQYFFICPPLISLLPSALLSDR